MKTIDLSKVQYMQFEGIDMRDYPDFCDAYLVYAELEDGRPLTDEELDYINDKHYDFVNENVYDSIC
jgi:hypothetical protein